jgi:hypothetical protein
MVSAIVARIKQHNKIQVQFCNKVDRKPAYILAMGIYLFGFTSLMENELVHLQVYLA